MNVQLVDHMGDDLSVVNAARVSFDKESDWEWGELCEQCNDYCQGPYLSNKDTKLINYLAKHKHWTPFGHAFASFRIKAPIFVARQLGKHQVGLVWNEVSRRYVDDKPEFYIPSEWRIRADNVKQGSSTETFDDEAVDGWLQGQVDYFMRHAGMLYANLLAMNIAPEMARVILPQNMYTTWVWSGSLAAFARVCKLRLDPHTQYETRLVAEQIDQYMAELFPVSWKALNAAPD